MAQAPAAFRSWAAVRSYVVTARRQAMVHHLDDDAALAHDLAMEEGALLDADAGQWGDDVESEGAAHSVVVLSEDDDAGRSGRWGLRLNHGVHMQGHYYGVGVGIDVEETLPGTGIRG